MQLGSKRQLGIRIGRVPLLLRAGEGALLETAARRYSFFRTPASDGIPVFLQRAVAKPRAPRGFHYDLAGRSLVMTRERVQFAGVNSEYDLDSLLRVLLSVVLLKGPGFLLHAATVVRGSRAYVFMGRSGAGKSTVASLTPAGSVLTDEISLLRCDHGAWQAYGTPFWGEFRADGQNRCAPLAGIFALVQAPHNRTEPMAGTRALGALLANTLFFAPGREAREKLLCTLAALISAVPVQRLQFQKDASFWEVLP